MKLLFSFVLVLVSVVLTLAGPKSHPLSDDFISSLNQHKSTWKAGRNFDAKTPLSTLRALVGVHPDNNLHKPKEIVHVVKAKIQEFFDARKQWPECKSLNVIRDQAVCGSCWAFGAVEAMSDRICIHSNGTKQVSVSAEDLLSCCSDCGLGCQGGFLGLSWEYWQEVGIVTGGLHDEKNGCRAYSFASCEHHIEGDKPACGATQPTPACVKQCDEGTNLDYKSELTFGQAAYSLRDESQIQMDILMNGPVEASFKVYEDFLSYKSGVYQNLEGDFLGSHAIKILGWGVEEGTPYWLIANSWNEDWGDKGYFKMLRGQNHLGIEGDVVAGLPKL